MDGKDEGMYAWITTNYLLNTIQANTPSNTPSYAILDLGGASTQIVFEPKFSKPDSSLIDGEHKYDLKFGGKMHVLYQLSYLGYGLMHAKAYFDCSISWALYGQIPRQMHSLATLVSLGEHSEL